MTAEARFKTGDVVVLNSGSPDLTVLRQCGVDNDHVKCHFWNYSGVTEGVKEIVIHQDMVRLVGATK